MLAQKEKNKLLQEEMESTLQDIQNMRDSDSRPLVYSNRFLETNLISSLSLSLSLFVPLTNTLLFGERIRNGSDALVTSKDEYNTLYREIDCTFSSIKKY
ncbi:hypothetical protein OUZ56_008321 [Daphnia magna]|uniref:Uncharacterized protein n=1 Tax=Daphnia magna TaxID=35525 RepID=A0ABR0ACN8_9CRUS|nr:hypothetical protein OUZ56_008321 [Daphnia magna]